MSAGADMRVCEPEGVFGRSIPVVVVDSRGIRHQRNDTILNYLFDLIVVNYNNYLIDRTIAPRLFFGHQSPFPPHNGSSSIAKNFISIITYFSIKALIRKSSKALAVIFRSSSLFLFGMHSDDAENFSLSKRAIL